MNSNERPKRVRQRKPELMLQSALNDAEELGRAMPTPENVERMRLVKARLHVLKSRVGQKLKNEIAELTRRVTELEAENARLRQESAAHPRYGDPVVDAAIAKYEAEKRNNVQPR